MTDHANELRRHARKIPHPQGETPGVMLLAADEIERLRAKIEAMERQEPVVEVQWAAGIPNGILDFISTDDYLPKLGDKLYALPGAKGE